MTMQDWLYKNTKDYRKEYKLIISPVSASGILHKAINSFPMLHPTRVVNSIYFDTPQYQLYQDAVTGQNERFKARIRWYGEQKVASQAFFEFKIRRGSSGTKISIPLGVWDLKYFMNAFKFRELVRSSNLPEPLQCFASQSEPVLKTVYHRKYLYVTDKVRMTVDYNLRTSKFIGEHEIYNETSRFTEEFPLIEIKHPLGLNIDLNHLINLPGCRTSRYSKYINGMNAFISGSYLASSAE